MIKNKISLKAPENFNELRLDKALGLLQEIGSRSRAENLIVAGSVLVNGKIVKTSYKVKTGDELQIELSAQVSSKEISPLDIPLDILFEDDDLLVVNKPAGLVVHPAAGHENDTLVNALVHHTKNLSMKFGENRPGIIHRIDRDTSGLLVVAKNDFAHEHLAQDFKQKIIHRIYYAICIGYAPKSSGKIQSFLARHPIDRKRFASIQDESRKIIRLANASADGKWSVTNYEVLATHSSGFSYLKLKLETGRTHQIRVHLSELGAPIAGDVLYGASKKNKNIKSTELRNLISEIPRFALHAAELGFLHPRTKENLLFKTPWPNDLQPLLTKLGFHEFS